MDRPQRLPGQGVLGGIESGDPEIGHLDASVLQHHDIVWLDIPVDHTLGMGMLQCLGDLGAEMQRFPPAHGTPLLHVLLEGQPVNELHHDVIGIPGVIHIVDCHDIRMGEHGDGLALRMEPSAEVLVPVQLLLEDLHRHITIETMVHGTIDHGHSAPADLLQDLIPAVEQPANILIHAQRSLRNNSIQHRRRTAVTLSGAPLRLAISISFSQMVSSPSPWVTS